MEVQTLKQKSNENFKSAKLLKQSTYYRASCSRFYYAMFLRMKDLCVNKLDYIPSSQGNSHNNMIAHYKSFMAQATYSDYSKLSKARNIVTFLYTAKDYRKYADYDEESHIDLDICNELEKYYLEMINIWSDVNLIIQHNK